MAYQTIYPYTNEVLQSYENLSDAGVEKALERAYGQYQAWQQDNDVEGRKAVLRQVAVLLRRDLDRYAETMTKDMGKLFVEAQGEVALCAAIAEYYADQADGFLAREPVETPAGKAYILKQARGVIMAVEPWNFPFYQVMRVFAPNFIIGNPLLLKHASNCPGSALAFEALVREAGAPEGAFQNLFASYDQVSRIIEDPRVAGACLTGSERGGSSVAEHAGKALKPSSLELGGNDAFIVLDDADMDEVKAQLFAARLYNAGQVCVSSKRFIVTEKNYHRFLQDLTEVFASAQWGDPMDPATTLAPLSSATAKRDVLAAIDQAVQAGARVVYGNQPIESPGYFVMPTILTDVTKDNPLYNKEVFGPVGVVYKVRDEEEAIALANDSSYGLGNTVFSSDMDHAGRVAARIETGMSFINHGWTSLPELPFGGVKNSGYGHELSRSGFDTFVNQHLVFIPQAVWERHGK